MPRPASSIDQAPPEQDVRRILFLCHRVPYPPDKGDRIRSYHLLAHLARLGQVDLAFPSVDPVSKGTHQALARLCHRFEAVPVSRSWRLVRAVWGLARGRSLTEGLFDSTALRTCLGSWLEEWNYDAVVCFSSGVLPYVLNRGLGPQLVADLVDVDSQKWFDYAGRTSWPKAALFQLEGRRVRALERAASRCCAVVFATVVEASIYKGFCPEASVETIPNGVDLDYFRPAPRPASMGSGGCVFIGQLDYRANVLGLEWFCREVWPEIRSRLPEATFEIVGRNPVTVVQRLEALPGVRVVGPVPDVRPYLATARMVVVPLPVARGVQNKVLEAMAAGRPVIATPAALEGLDLVQGRDALAAKGVDDWCRTVAELWNDPVRRDELGRHARSYVEVHHRWEISLRRFDSIIAAAAVGRPSSCGASTCK